MLKQLQEDMKAAMKGKDSDKVSVLRMVISDAKKYELDKGETADEAVVVSIIQKAIKMRAESVEQYRKGGREDLAEKETKEQEILKAYMPEALSEEELDAALKKIIDETGASTQKDIGKVMGKVMAEFRGRVDGKAVQQKVSAMLA